jgi:mono/diheme cytochrome c family protein
MKRFVQAMVVLVALLCLSSVLWVSGARALSSAAKRRDAATIFKNECASCHGKDGGAKTLKAKFNGAKDLTKAGWQENASDEHIFNVIANGHGKMPAYGKKLSQAEIESLVTYIRKLKK